MEGDMTVLVLGAFDCLHWGHQDFLARAGVFGDVVVGLSGDSLLEATKSPPVFSFEERKSALESSGYRVVARERPSAKNVFLDVMPKVFVCGNDWLGEDHLEAAGITRRFLNDYDITVIYTPRPHDMSTSTIIDRIRSREAA